MTSEEKTTVIRSLLAWYQYHASRGGQIFTSYKSLRTYVADNEDYLRKKQVLLVGKTGHATLVTSDFGSTVYEHLFGHKGQ